MLVGNRTKEWNSRYTSSWVWSFLAADCILLHAQLSLFVFYPFWNRRMSRGKFGNPKHFIGQFQECSILNYRLSTIQNILRFTCWTSDIVAYLKKIFMSCLLLDGKVEISAHETCLEVSKNWLPCYRVLFI